MQVRNFLSLFTGAVLVLSFTMMNVAFAQTETAADLAVDEEVVEAESMLISEEVEVEVEIEMDFDDVDEMHENLDAIKYLNGAGVVVGYGDGTFKPDNSVNRAEFLKIVMESKGFDVSEAADCYSDVTDEWFAPYVCGATELELVKGYDDGYFRPEQTINFVEASKIITNAFLLSMSEASGETWYQQFVTAMELVNAIPSTIDTFDKSITRGETAEMVWRIKTENKGEASLTYAEIKMETEHRYGEIEVEMEVEKEEANVAEDRVAEVTAIVLEDKGEGMVKWVAEGDSAEGYKVVWSMTAEPTYPLRATDKYQYFSDSTVDTAEVTAFDGDGTYYVRVCEYVAGECGVYSNEIAVELVGAAVEEVASTVTSIVATDNADGTVSWVAEGDSAEGYKVVWSMTSEPTYPLRANDKYQYFSDAAVTSSDGLNAFDGVGTYYVRVCEYLGGACGVYSNELTVEL